MRIFFLSDMTFWDSSLSIVASLLGIGTALFGALGWLYTRRKQSKSIPKKKQKQDAVNVICKSYAEKISNWFLERTSLLQAFAKRADLRTNKNLHTESLLAIAASVDGFPGGFYTLDENGIVIDHLVPHHPKMDIRGYDASQREYFLECERLHRPVVSNAIRSANRNTDILVVAVPRYQDSGHFVGVLDAVVDVASAPFSELAVSAEACIEIKEDLEGQVLLYFVDGRGVILGSNSALEILGKSVFQFAPQVTLAAEGFVFSAGIGEKRSIAGTPFSVIAIWKDRKT